MHKPDRLDALTSWRFVAAAMIVVGHGHALFGSFGLATTVPLEQGVSFFFVLSGFILSYNYPRLDGHGARAHFWAARFARIWPLHIVMLAAWLVLAYEFDRAAFFPGLEGMLRLAANMLLLQSWVPVEGWTTSFNAVSWSLSAEVFFYAAFPWLIAYWPRHWHRLLFAQVAIVALFIVLATLMAKPGAARYVGITSAGLIYFNPLVRVLEFSAGIGAASIVRRISTRRLDFSAGQWLFLELAVIAMCAVGLLAVSPAPGIWGVLGEAGAFYFFKQGLAWMFAVVIAVFAVSRGPCQYVLSRRPLIFLGEISFALYMCHALILRYLEPYEIWVRDAGVAAYALFWLLLLLASTALFYGVEQPARRLVLAMMPLEGRVKQHGRINRTVSVVSLLIWVSMVAAAAVFRPTMREVAHATEVNQFLASEGRRFEGRSGTFDGRYAVIGFAATSHAGDNVTLEFLLRAEITFEVTDMLAVHLNGPDGEILVALGSRMENSRRQLTTQGTYWIERIKISRSQYEAAHSVGVAMYRQVTDLYAVSGGRTDWEGRRLVLPKIDVGAPVVWHRAGVHRRT
jgi:peptidoglycan/LPS O-acetylase OafA/YrhL